MLFSPPDLISSEAMEMKLPNRCPVYKKCKECQFCIDSLSFKENAEYELILGKLQLENDKQKWVAAYSFTSSLRSSITTMHRL
jgi:hypothetical protein